MKRTARRSLSRPVITVLGLLVAAGTAQAQFGSAPPPDAPTRVVFSALDLDRLAAEDAAVDGMGQAPMRFAVPQEVEISPTDHGTLQEMAEGRVAWTLTIASENASNLNIAATFDLPPSVEVFLLDGDARQHYRGFTASDAAEGELWMPVVPDGVMNVVAEMDADEWEDFAQSFTIFRVNLGYRAFGGVPIGDGSGRSAACHIDVACPEADPWEAQVRSTVRYVIGGGGLCSGAMINNTAQDGRPLMYTANHCGIRTFNDNTLQVYFNYENSFCRPPGSGQSGAGGNGSLSQVIVGSQVLMNWDPGDTTLVELNSTPPGSWGVFYAGWDRQNRFPTSAVGIHHPSGEEKRISIENNGSFAFSSTLTGVQFDEGGIEGGSSGSALFNQNGLIVGTACCVNTTVACSTSPPQQTYYGALQVAWNGGGSVNSRLRDHLDPLGTNVSALSGLGEELPLPGDFALTAPADGAQVPDDSSLLLQWSASENANVYVLDVARDAGFSDPLFTDISAISPQFTISAFLLEPGETYFWRVTARNTFGDTESSSGAWSFSTPPVAPECPEDVTGDGQIDVLDLNAVLAAFNQPASADPDADITDDGQIDVLDLNAVLAAFNTACP